MNTVVINDDTKLFFDDFTNLPEGVTISTISFSIKLGTAINVDNIYKYYPLNEDNFKLFKTDKGLRTIIPEKIKKKKKSFSNQITVVLSVFLDENKQNNKDINIKIFEKGTLQVSGCTNVFQADYTIKKIIKLLRGNHYILVDDNDTHVDFKKEGFEKIKKVRFFQKKEFESLYPKFTMINCKFLYDNMINLEELHEIIGRLKREMKIGDNIFINLNMNIGSAVTLYIYDNNFSDVHEDKCVSVKIYESGIITMQSCRSSEEICEIYFFVKTLLDEHKNYICKKDIMATIAQDKKIKKYIDLEALSKVYCKFV